MVKQKLRVWWATEVPFKNAERYDVEDLKEAKKKIEELTQRDLKNSSVTDNVGGLEYFDEDEQEWCEWYSDDGYDIMEVMGEEE